MINSSIEEHLSPVDGDLDLRAIGNRVRALRKGRGDTLANLAARADLSVSMLSAVERGEKAATVLVLHRIAGALGSTIARLVEDETPVRATVLRHDRQIVIPGEGGWTRRIVSPVVPGIEFEMMQTTLPPGVNAGEYGPHQADSQEYLLVLEGELTLTLDGTEHRLAAGDAIHHDGQCRHGYRNDGPVTCRYVLAMFDRPRP
ncbi:XRE family transcriptional regulator [Thalassobaculum sp.]|uniref:helix-turn-helix domain-containing protein n=1 Tax=Thalassobaculum sp. TaxID=2022740 RepID=UPI0032EF06D8